MIDLDEGPGSTSGWWPKAAAGAALLVLISGGVYNEWASARSAVGPDGCPRSGPTALGVVGFDTTDQLLLANPGRAETAIAGLVGNLSGGGKLVLAQIDADVTSELRLAFNRCAPPRDRDVTVLEPKNPQMRARIAFENDVKAAVREFAQAPDGPRSPLAEQIVKIVTDGRILVAGLPRERNLTIFSDLLQASSSGNAYSGHLQLPARPPRVLVGWRVRFIQTTNPRDHARQTDAIRAEWRRWALAAGATSVSFEGSGFVDSARAP